MPPILVSGDHGAVRRWRHREAIRRTLERRPDLLVERAWTPFERTLLDEIEADAASRATADREGPSSRASGRASGRRRRAEPCYTPPSVALAALSRRPTAQPTLLRREVRNHP